MLDFNRGSGCTGPGWQPPDPVGLAGVLVAGMSEDQLDRLVRLHLSPSARRARRLAERDAAIRALAAGLPAGSGREAARRLAGELTRYAASGWRFERGGPAPEDLRRAALYRVLTLNRGELVGVAQCRRALAAVAQNQGSK